VNAPMASSNLMTTYTPRMSQGNNSIRVRHRELFGVINGFISFTKTALNLNPGNSVLFPWLGIQAKMWERYRFHRLRMHYVTRCATTVGGSVIMAADYNCLTAGPVNEQSMLSYQGAVEDVAWKDIICDVDPSALHPGGIPKYVRGRYEFTGQDLKTYDAAELYIATTGFAADNTQCGRLFLEYDVEFYTPQIDPPNAISTRMYGVALATQVIPTATLTTLVNSSVLVDCARMGLTQAAGLVSLHPSIYKVNCSGVVLNTIAELFTVNAHIYHNLAQVTTVTLQSDSGGYLSWFTEGIINAAEGDTMSIAVTLTGATGVLTVEHSEVYIQPV